MTQPITTPEPVDRASASCTEGGCTTTVTDTPDNRCGGTQNGGAQGCGDLYCGEHLYVTDRDGNLCADDYNNLGADRAACVDEDQITTIRLPEVSGRWAGATAAEQAKLVEAAHSEALAEDAARGTTAELTEQPESWLFTFGGGQVHADRFVVIPGTYGQARAEMLRRFGQAWCGQYPIADRAEMEGYGLTELGGGEPVEPVEAPVPAAAATVPVEVPAEPAPPPGVDAIREMADRYRRSEQDYAFAAAFGDQAGMGRALRAMSRRQAALVRVTLAVLDAQAAGRAATR